MELYLHATYEHSKNGYVLMHVKKDGLEKVSAEENTPSVQLARNFFFYEGFRIIWKDFCLDSRRAGIYLVPNLSMAAMRGLEGSISGRRGNMDLAVIGNMEELSFLRRVMLAFVGDYEFHERKLFANLTIGEGGRLEGDGKRIWESLIKKSGKETYKKWKEYKKGKLWESMINLRSSALTERELFRFAVCQIHWKEISSKFTPSWLWKKKPKGVISSEIFDDLCGKE